MIQLFVIIGVVAILAFLVWAIDFRTTPEQKRLQRLSEEIHRDGIRADAVVKKIDFMSTGTGYRVTSFYIEWTLEVTLPNGTPYEVSQDIFAYDKRRFSMNPAVASYAGKVGARIPVMVHPTEPQAVKIDGERLMRLAVNGGQ